MHFWMAAIAVRDLRDVLIRSRAEASCGPHGCATQLPWSTQKVHDAPVRASGSRGYRLRLLTLPVAIAVVAPSCVISEKTPDSKRAVISAGRVRPVGQRVFPCANGEHAWTWSSTENRIAYWGADGTVVASWVPPSPIQRMYSTRDCRVAWAVDHGLRVARFEASSPGIVWSMAAETTLPGEPEALHLNEDGTIAWAVTDSTVWSPVRLVVRGQSIVATRSRKPSAFYQHEKSASEMGGASLWLIPGGANRGLDTVGADNAIKEHAALSKVNVCNVFTSASARVIWALPCRADEGDQAIQDGLYLLGPSGEPLNDGKPYLAPVSFGTSDEDFHTVSWSPYVWAWSESVDLFAFKVTASGATPVVTLLNQGRPIPISGASSPRIKSILTSPGNAMLGTPSNEAWVWSSLMVLSVDDGDGVAISDSVDARFAPEGIAKAAASSVRPNVFWFKTPDLQWSELEVDHSGRISGVRPIPISGVDAFSIADAVPAKESYWVTGNVGQGLLLDRPAVTAASVEWNSWALTTDDHSAVKVEALPGEIASARARLDWIGRKSTTKAAMLTVELFPAGNRKAPAVAVGHVAYKADQEVVPIQIAVLRDFEIGKAYDVVLKFSDDDHTQISATWAGISFNAPLSRRLLQEPHVAAFLWVLVPILLASALFQSSRTIRRYAPIIFPSAEAIVSKIADVGHLSPGPIALAAAALLIASIFAGLVSASLFRALAVMQPFAVLVPIALRCKPIRRRVFARYAVEFEKTIQALRADANLEVYVPCPLYELELESHTDHVTPKPRHWEIGELATALEPSDDGQRTHVVFLAPGGRGKSAALHALAEELLSRWRRDPLLPLPVLCRGAAPSVGERARRAFGADLVSVEYLAGQIESGDVVLLIDSPTEGGLDSNAIDEHLRTKKSRLCIATRPSEELVRTFRLTPERSVFVEPAALDDTSLSRFLNAYLKPKTVAESGEALAQPSPSLEAMRLRMLSYRGTDGSYLPLIVRLAMLVDASPNETLCSLYDGTVARLLMPAGGGEREQGALKKTARELARTTYWTARMRVFPAERTDPTETDTIGRFVQCGLLVGAGTRPRRGAAFRSRQVRFFHDSMQSYLAAKALALDGDRSVLVTAATTPAFRAAQSELLGSLGPEMFQMCVLTFDEREPLEPWFEGELQSWAQRAEDAWNSRREMLIELAALQIAIPEDVSNAVAATFEAPPNAIEFLRRLIEYRPNSGFFAERRDYLACAYATLAPSFVPAVDAAKAARFEDGIHGPTTVSGSTNASAAV